MTKDKVLMGLIEYVNSLNSGDYSICSWREVETALMYSKYAIRSMDTDVDMVVAIDLLETSLKNLDKK